MGKSAVPLTQADQLFLEPTLVRPPLAPVVVDWFRELRTLAGSSAYVLPAHSRSRAARHGGDTHLKKVSMAPNFSPFRANEFSPPL